MKKISISFLLLTLFTIIYAQNNVVTYPYAERTGETLYLDLYQPDKATDNDYCIIFVFGGGFKGGSRNAEENVSYCHELAKLGYTVAAIDYRLGLKDVTKMGISEVKTLEKAIDYAVEDLYSATRYLVENGEKLKISKEHIIILGTSAGAITVLEADYKAANANKMAEILPKDFKYAGVISFSGAILSREGKINYNRTPAPTLMYHGTSDKLVTYNQIQFFNLGFFGTNKIVNRFQKFGYSYYAYHFKGLGHEVAGQLLKQIESTDQFIKTFILKDKRAQVDSYVKDMEYKSPWYSQISPKKLYKMSQEEINKMEKKHNSQELKIQNKPRR